eukprot:scaffold35166_cov73-Cyclotella_meneghiniana.AAC.8
MVSPGVKDSNITTLALEYYYLPVLPDVVAGLGGGRAMGHGAWDGINNFRLTSPTTDITRSISFPWPGPFNIGVTFNLFQL